MKLGFLGMGNMASAIIRSLSSQNIISDNSFYAYDSNPHKLDLLTHETGLRSCSSAYDLINQVDALFLAVKPDVIPSLLTELRTDLEQKNCLIISIAAGISLKRLEQLTGTDRAIIRAMPNINLTIGEGMSAVCSNAMATRDQTDYVLKIFNTCGKAIELEEKHFSTFTALAGSSPAFVYLFIDSLARAAVKHGLPKDLATQIAAQATSGSAKMLMEGKDNPWTLIDKVCSPGGTTVAGLLALEERNFIATIVNGIDATIAREKELQTLS